MEKFTELLISYSWLINIDKHSPSNLFTLENISISTSLIAVPNKSSLPINNISLYVLF